MFDISPEAPTIEQSETTAYNAKTSNPVVMVTKEIETAEPSSSKTNENSTHLAWNKLHATQDNKSGRCDICGKKHQPLVFYEFEDQFGKGQGNLCYDCFCKKCK